MGGYGLFTSELLSKEDLILSVPLKYMICTCNAPSELREIIQKDPILSQSQSLALTLQLWYESQSQDSFYKPYISLLPSELELNLPLFYTKEELHLLKGSHVQCNSLRNRI